MLLHKLGVKNYTLWSKGISCYDGIFTPDTQSFQSCAPEPSELKSLVLWFVMTRSACHLLLTCRKTKSTWFATCEVKKAHSRINIVYLLRELSFQWCANRIVNFDPVTVSPARLTVNGVVKEGEHSNSVWVKYPHLHCEWNSVQTRIPFSPLKKLSESFRHPWGQLD